MAAHSGLFAKQGIAGVRGHYLHCVFLLCYVLQVSKRCSFLAFACVCEWEREF